MDILVFGAGVLGTLYATRLQEAGHRVSLVARGARLAELREHGIVLESAQSGRWTAVGVNIVEALAPDDRYDLAIVLVRHDQLAGALPTLAANRRIPTVLLMVNNASGPSEAVQALGHGRVLLGFPGAGGARRGHVVRYNVLPGWLQATTLGELDGRSTPRLRTVAAALRRAGFPVEISGDIDAWLKTHVAWVSPVANALYMVGGSNDDLAHTRDGVVLMVRAIREGFRVLRAHGIPITPARLRLFEWLPEPLLVVAWRRVLATRFAATVIAGHANAARSEMAALAAELRALAAGTGVPTPAMDELAAYADPAQPTAPVGSARLPLRWQGLLLALTMAAGLALAVRLRRACSKKP
ncbi:MAG TPA: 2-dehydropantoate 2-reductase N-terminal domain-containing protein [Anaerolineae bacterium]|nr:2-dehydropantoate 2-reductase N-terminal domain-containing protein [Anaerolineae bacterium]HOQ99432.1 2-dehydropantoate 2-reductase N-terminal domain-containing protein [Anaerolineae bacterium]HPL29385.1 2-dehydropantoate 2-reductase N-terminal domain-containing protein [Anaerolineae bacterium]